MTVELINKVKGVLSFYSNKKNYKTTTEINCSLYSIVELDNGRKAAEVLDLLNNYDSYNFVDKYD